MLSQVMDSVNCGNGRGALAIQFLLTHNIPAIKLGDSKSLLDMEFFLTSPTLLRDRNRPLFFIIEINLKDFFKVIRGNLPYFLTNLGLSPWAGS